MRKILIRFLVWLLHQVTRGAVQDEIDDYLYGVGYTEYYRNLFSDYPNNLTDIDHLMYRNTPNATKYRTLVIRFKTIKK